MILLRVSPIEGAVITLADAQAAGDFKKANSVAHGITTAVGVNIRIDYF